MCTRMLLFRCSLFVYLSLALDWRRARSRPIHVCSMKALFNSYSVLANVHYAAYEMNNSSSFIHTPGLAIGAAVVIAIVIAAVVAHCILYAIRLRISRD